MKNSNKFLITIILLVSMIATGCSWELERTNKKLAEEATSLKEEVKVYEAKISDLEKEIDELTKYRDTMGKQKSDLLDKQGDLYKQITSLSDELDKTNATLNQLLTKYNLQREELISLSKDDKLSKDYLILPVYGMDYYTIEKEIRFYTIISKNISLEEKIKYMADKLSQRCFEGSAGGSATSITLVETFLQREYEGDWIDGVKFLYYNEDVQFEHVAGLEKTIYR